MAETIHKGQCLCGAVTYEIAADPVMVGHCCCTDCRRVTGAAHMTAAMFPEEAFTLSGEVKAYGVTADSGNQVDRYFCPDCGGRLYAINSGNPGIRAVMVGSLDHPEVLNPGVIVYGDSQLPWDIHDGNLPKFPKMPG